TRCRMAGPDAAPASRSVATNHCAALLAGGMPTFHLAEPGSLPRRGEFRSYVSVGRAAGTTGRR
ncbi:hypothetical protein, partial [Allosphingosinicella sp.]|uniref:hypothetical protein n=1 Tax=Allosphingosinicella sp. TaxID=2823234 RepID=UPI002EE1301D